MSLYSDPPPLRTFTQDKPTLLVCWWITAFCTVIILLRVAGRFIRSERLFKEDKVASLALIPMYLRMGCVHVILLYGTNNAAVEGAGLSAEAIRRKEIASGLVIASRLLYAATLWILKDCILEYFRRLTESISERYISQTLIFIRATLITTFVAIFISTLAECRPFNHYWQVVPDPGGQCRQGYAQLFTMATCNILTDFLLVFFPVPIILHSQLGIKKKVQLTLLFSLSLVVVAVTLYRLPHIVWEHGSQQLRSLLASVELLFATTAANSLVLGSFVRDRGVKKLKFRYGSVAADSIDRPLTSRSRRPTLQRHWGSDEDLVRDIGLGVNPELRDVPEMPGEEDTHRNYMPAPLVRRFGDDLKHWSFPHKIRSHAARSERSDDSLLPRDPLSYSRTNSTTTPRRVSFFDVGGLLSEEPEDPGSSSSNTFRRGSHQSGGEPVSPRTQALPSPAFTAHASGQRRGSTAVLQDLGGLFGPTHSRPGHLGNNGGDTELQPISPPSRYSDRVIYDPSSTDGPQLVDAGGLLKRL